MKFKSLALAAALASSPLYAANYVIDTAGAHASVNFKLSHLGYSYVLGRFNTFAGEFSYDAAAPQDSSISLTIDTTSLDSNHAERDKHLRSDDFLSVENYPEASFVSTSFEDLGDNKAKLVGDLTLRGVTKSIEIDVTKVGEGTDPWGGYRVGFEGTTALALKDYGIDYNLGPAAEMVYMDLHIEGVRQ